MSLPDQVIESVDSFFSAASGALWGWPSWPVPAMVVALVGTGLYLTFRLRFINIRGFGHALAIVSGKYDDPEDPGDVSHFQALTTALSATVGVGNIAGVATAIHYGGPGALFWMWVTAAVGMTSKYTECTLAVRYRCKNSDGTVSGGPMYYIERGLGPRWKPLAMIFALCATVSSFGSGNAIQANTMSDAVQAAYGVPTWLTGIVSVTLIGLVIVGGIRRIGRFTARVIPLMAVAYFVGAVFILVFNYREIPDAVVSIFVGAFRPAAALGGFAGATFLSTMMWGVKRGLFSNEAGQGSAPIAHAAARTDEPVREGLVALLEPFIDTLTVCTLTGLVILCTGAWHDRREATYPLTAQSSLTFVGERCEVLRAGKLSESCPLRPGRYPMHHGIIDGVRFKRYQSLVDSGRLLVGGEPAEGALLVNAGPSFRLVDDSGETILSPSVAGYFVENGEPLTAWAFRQGLAPIFPYGDKFVTICVFLFALSTAIGWSYYGDRGSHYLFGERAMLPYRLAFLTLHFAGAVFSHEGVWGFGDVALGLMALPNLFTILALSGQVATMTRDYYARQRNGSAKTSKT